MFRPFGSRQLILTKVQLSSQLKLASTDENRTVETCFDVLVLSVFKEYSTLTINHALHRSLSKLDSNSLSLMVIEFVYLFQQYLVAIFVTKRGCSIRPSSIL